ncbi:MAG: SDR family NAD(P)-dependent oxidoreductase [Parvibaculales bacterium]
MATLKNKTAFITGGGQGVGQGIALALAAEGANVFVVGRTQQTLDDTCALIEARGVQAGNTICDIMKADDLETAVAACLSKFGGLDILVNNAQLVPLGPLNGLTEEAFEEGWVSGPVATLRLMKLCYPHLKNGGNIINLLSSAMRRWDMANYGGYSAVKAAIHELTRAAACEWGEDGIRVNAIMPHAKSPALANWIERNPAEAEAFQATIPLKRIGECEDDIGAFVALMCSDKAGYLTGQTIGLDGGQALIG